MMKPRNRSIPVHNTPDITCRKFRNQTCSLTIAPIITISATAAATSWPGRTRRTPVAGGGVDCCTVVMAGAPEQDVRWDVERSSHRQLFPRRPAHIPCAGSG